MFDVGNATNALIEVAVTLLIIAAVVAALEGLLYLILVRWLKARLAVPLMLLAPAVFGLLILNVWPLIWELNVSFTKMGLSATSSTRASSRLTAQTRTSSSASTTS